MDCVVCYTFHAFSWRMFIVFADLSLLSSRKTVELLPFFLCVLVILRLALQCYQLTVYIPSFSTFLFRFFGKCVLPEFESWSLQLALMTWSSHSQHPLKRGNGIVIWCLLLAPALLPEIRFFSSFSYLCLIYPYLKLATRSLMSAGMRIVLSHCCQVSSWLSCSPRDPAVTGYDLGTSGDSSPCTAVGEGSTGTCQALLPAAPWAGPCFSFQSPYPC